MTTTATTARVQQKSLMSMKQILLMNLGFFGIQYSFGMQQTAMTPLYSMLGASPEELPLLNLAGPITGLLIQPIIGALSDGTWVEKGFFRGRRRPFFLIGAIGKTVNVRGIYVGSRVQCVPPNSGLELGVVTHAELLPFDSACADSRP